MGIDTKKPTTIVSQVGMVSFWNGFCKLSSSQKNPLWDGFMGITWNNMSAIPSTTRQTISMIKCHRIWRGFAISSSAMYWNNKYHVEKYSDDKIGRICIVTYKRLDRYLSLSVGLKTDVLNSSRRLVKHEYANVGQYLDIFPF